MSHPILPTRGFGTLQLRSHRHVLKPALLALCIASLCSSALANFAINNFNTDLGTWTTTMFNHDNGYNLDWSNTGNASGIPGEVGGLVIRSNSTTTITALGMPRILDTSSFVGSPVNLNMPISVSGKMYLQDISAASDAYLGYFNAADPSAQRLGLNIRSPSTAGSKLWRIRPKANGVNGGSVTFPNTTWDSASLDFTFTWVPSGLNDGRYLLFNPIEETSPVLLPISRISYVSREVHTLPLPLTSPGTPDTNPFSARSQYPARPVNAPVPRSPARHRPETREASWSAAAPCRFCLSNNYHPLSTFHPSTNLASAALALWLFYSVPLAPWRLRVFALPPANLLDLRHSSLGFLR